MDGQTDSYADAVDEIDRQTGNWNAALSLDQEAAEAGSDFYLTAI